jgi:hypothetical protein
MSQQSQAEQRTSKAGRPYLNAIRDGDNAVSLKSLFLDVDVKGSGYPDTKTAVTELGVFRRAVGLPAPNMIVQSGSGGFHAHWVLDEPLLKSEWSTLAYQLADAAKKHGLKCDTQCTIDSARVLRFPNTKNFKYDPPGQVEFLTPRGTEYSVALLRTPLAAFSAPPVASTYNLPPRPPLTGPCDLAAGIETYTAPAVNLDSVAKSCGFIREAIETGGATYSNPLWNLTTLVSLFSEGGREDAHRMARNHQGYLEADTDALYDRKQAEQQKKDLGWPSCKTIAASGCTACSTCALLPAAKSPLNYAAPRTTLKPSNDLPPKYLTDENNFVYLQTVDEEGNNTRRLVCEYPLFNGWLQRGPWHLHFSTIIEKGLVDTVTIPFELISTMEPLQRHISAFGLVMGPQSFKHFKDFMMAWVDTLRKTKRAVVNTSPFGWIVNENGVGFAFGGRIFSKDGEGQSAAPRAALAQIYTPRGQIEPWRAAAKVVTNQERVELNMILAASFGAPLMKFSGQEGALISAYSVDSGIGKSTVVKVAQAVWGHPKLGVPQLNDTANSVVGYIGEIKSLPLFWDELKTEEDRRKFVNIAFQMSSGRGKARMNSNAEQREIATWETLLVACSNDALTDIISAQTKTTTAGMMRVIEFVVPPGTKGRISKTEAAVVSAKLKDNFGWVGLEYARFLGENAEMVEADMFAMCSSLDDEGHFLDEERLWLAGFGAVLQGATYAKRLGYLDIDVDELRAFCLSTLTEMRKDQAMKPVDMRKRINVSNILTQFFKEMQANHTIYTNRIHVGRGKPSAGQNKIQIKNNTANLRGVIVQVGLEDQRLRISQFHLSGWLDRNKYPQRVFLDSLRREFQMRTLTGRLASGTEKATGDEYLYQIELAGTPLAELANYDGSKEVEPEDDIAE